MNKQHEEYLIKKVKNKFSIIEHQFYQEFMNSNYNPNYDEQSGTSDDWFNENIADLFYLILSFFESRQLHLTYNNFLALFEEAIKTESSLLKEKFDYEQDYAELVILRKFRRFLNPFPEFDYNENLTNDSIKLHQLLGNTDFILKKSGNTITGEADIYKAVKWVMELYFPKVRSRNKASFIRGFKSYHPDILVPELKTAIEYKYIRSKKENDIDEYLDQIKIDSVNYEGDSRYENFIAVVYFKNSSIATPQRIMESWKEKKFPKNWKLILTFNSGT